MIVNSVLIYFNNKSMENSILLDKYKIIKKLGEGSFAEVYKAKNLHNRKNVAIKIERPSRFYNIEAEVLTALRGKEGFPFFFEKFEHEGYNYTVMELLGETLHDLRKKANGKFSISTVVAIGLQLLERLRNLHNAGFIHRDLKPQQFLVGKKDKERVYIVDFGMCKKYRLASIHIPFQTNCSKAGNATFASINIHRRIQASRRDDMEALAYFLIYCIKGKLPWQNTANCAKIDKWVRIGAAKSKITTEELCEQLPSEFVIITNYCKSLEFDETPNYELLRNVLINLAKKMNLSMKIDWMNKCTDRISKRPTNPQDAESTNYESVHINRMKNNKDVTISCVGKAIDYEAKSKPDNENLESHSISLLKSSLEESIKPDKIKHTVKFKFESYTSDSGEESEFDSEHSSCQGSEDSKLEDVPSAKEPINSSLVRKETIKGQYPTIMDRNKIPRLNEYSKAAGDSKICPIF
jgi:serine/threonine protein kinase